MGNRLLQEDLYQEVMIIFLEYNKAAITEIYNLGKFRFWFIRVVCNTYKSTNSPFYKKFLKHLDYIDQNYHLGLSDDLEDGRFTDLANISDDSFEDEQRREAFNTLVAGAKEELDKMSYYDRELFKLFVEIGSRKAIARLTGIPFRSVGDKINLVQKVLEIKLQPVLMQSA